MNSEAKKKWDREYKRMKRRTDPEWLARERARRRIYGKNRTRDPKKYQQYVKTYRSKEQNKLKEKARAKLKWAIDKGEVVVPEKCQKCNRIPRPFKTKRRPLRADHYKGYDYPLEIQFICVDCDGKQLRAKNDLVA